MGAWKNERISIKRKFRKGNTVTAINAFIFHRSYSATKKEDGFFESSVTAVAHALLPSDSSNPRSRLSPYKSEIKNYFL